MSPSRATYLQRSRPEAHIAFLEQILSGLVEHLPEHVSIVEDEIQVDGDWIVEPIIKKMPIVLGKQ